jgi:hypothetical protein
MAITLDSTTKSIEISTSTASSTDWSVSYVDSTTTTFVPKDSQGNITSITNTTIVAAPASSTQRGIKQISISNKGTADQSITIYKNVSSTLYTLYTAVLHAGYSVHYDDFGGWKLTDNAGREIKLNPIPESSSVTTIPFYKSATAADTVAYWYGYWKDTGFPGAWSPNTPTHTIAGRTVSGSEAGAICPSTGNTEYIQHVDLISNIANYHMLADILWITTGCSATTTTAQTINSVTLPPRDINGTSSGVGCWIGVYSTAANNNAAAVTNSTISYTNSNGVNSRTATLSALNAGDNFPATPVIGSVVWFQLAAGDQGVQSIQNLTLNTSLSAGSIAVFIARPIIAVPQVVANLGVTDDYPEPGIPIYPSSNLQWFYRASATTATTLNGNILFRE